MRKPEVNYRELRLSRLNTPEYAHIWLLSGWVFYLLFYFLTERLIPLEACHLIHTRLDDLIPFNEYFAVFYISWYFYLVGTLLWFFIYDVDSFRKLQIYIIVTQVVAIAVYILYPSVQDLRPETFPRQNLFSAAMGLIYAADTPSGVCPSLHVAYSLGIASAWLKAPRTSRLWKAFMVFMAVMISLSVAFVKQHSTMDIFTALPLCFLAEMLAYGPKGNGGPLTRLLFPHGKSRYETAV